MNIQEFKCPSCGADLVWDSAGQIMKCEYCGNTFSPDLLEEYTQEESQQSVEDYAWEAYRSNGEVNAAIRNYVCGSCGGQISADANTAATNCPYCDSPVVLDSNVAGLLEPDLIIPFKKDKEDAKKALEKFCRKKPLLPNGFHSENRLEEIKGIYVPFWLFDCDADGKIRYDATKVKNTHEGEYDVSRTEHYMVVREGTAKFSCVPVDGSTTMEDNYMEAIEPFDVKDGVDFKTAYLSGYLADRYDVDSADAMPRANERVSNGIEALLRDTVKGYSSVVTKNKSIFVKKGRIRYAMMPVWILSTQFRGKVYKFAMNGQTGRFVGELPVSKGKFAAYLLGLTAALGTIGSLIGLFIL